MAVFRGSGPLLVASIASFVIGAVALLGAAYGAEGLNGNDPLLESVGFLFLAGGGVWTGVTLWALGIKDYVGVGRAPIFLPHMLIFNGIPLGVLSIFMRLSHGGLAWILSMGISMLLMYSGGVLVVAGLWKKPPSGTPPFD
jgi:hypothetical protein